ncbi:MAG: hypothetical protein ACHQF4_01085 [Sphingobacteriales bacterium]
MKQPAIIEVEELNDTPLDTYQQILYNLPNFRTKLNLLNLFMQDDELFTKVVVFVNTRITANTVYKNLKPQLRDSVVILNPMFSEDKGISDINIFKSDDKLRVLVIANENSEDVDISTIPFFIHLDLPEEKDLFVNRVIKNTGEEDTLAIAFATDIELVQVKKIEQVLGKKIALSELPDDLVIDNERKEKEAPTEKKPAKADKNAPVVGEAFHEKKASNSKTYNYSSGTKAKMNNKRKHS